jgi:hypothetical protein
LTVDLKEGYDLSWKQQKISEKQKKAEEKTVRCYNWHEKDRRTDKKSHVNDGTKFYCVEFGHNVFFLNVDEGKTAPKLRKAHGDSV